MKQKLINLCIALWAFVLLDYGISAVLRSGIDNYFGLNQHADMLLIGHSHLMLSVDKPQMAHDLGIKISKYCREGSDVEDKYLMTKQFLDSPYSDSLKILMYGVDLFTFSPGGLSSNSYLMFYPFMDNDDVDDMIRTCSSESDYWLHKLIRTYRFNDSSIMNASIRGLMDDWSNKKFGQVDVVAYQKIVDEGQERHILMDQNLINRFKETISMATNRGIRVILVNTPTLDILNRYEPKQFEAISEWYRDFASSHELVEYWDYNPEYASRHEIFYDKLHVNVLGQKVMNERITQDLKQFF